MANIWGGFLAPNNRDNNLDVERNFPRLKLKEIHFLEGAHTPSISPSRANLENHRRCFAPSSFETAFRFFSTVGCLFLYFWQRKEKSNKNQTVVKLQRRRHVSERLVEEKLFLFLLVLRCSVRFLDTQTNSTRAAAPT